MKRFALCVMAAVMAAVMSGCVVSTSLPGISERTEVISPEKDRDEADTVKELTEEEVCAAFSGKTQNADKSIVDCVLASDKAFGCEAVILFTESGKYTAGVAFADADGNSQICGVEAKMHSEPELTYLGNGEVAFKLQTEDGTAYNCRITFSKDGENVSFKAEDDLK